jgi:hypothetical protein
MTPFTTLHCSETRQEKGKMSQVSRGPRRFVHAAAHYLGYEVPAERPPKGDKEKQAKALRGIRAFHMAIARGRAPEADGKEGSRCWWYQSTLDAWLARSAKRGVGDAAA